MRKFFVGGNWKMNGSKQLADELVKSLNQGSWSSAVEVAIAPPVIYLDTVRQQLRPDIIVSAQNVHYEKSGAYTGETSVEMLKEFNINWTIIGHSERREIFHESDAVIKVFKSIRLLLKKLLLQLVMVCQLLLVLEKSWLKEMQIKQRMWYLDNLELFQQN